MAELASVLSSAFDEAIKGEAAPSTTSEPAPEPASAPAAPEAKTEAKPEPAAKTAAPEQKPEATEVEEPTGDVLMDKLTADEIAAIKADPKLRKVYSGLMKSYTPKMQQLAEQQKLWDALNNPDTKRAAIESLARAVGLEIKPDDQPERDQAAQVADGLSAEWEQAIGPEAVKILRPLIEKTALAAVQGQIKPLQEVSDAMQMDARARQADAQVVQFRARAEKNGWTLSPEIEGRMAELGQQVLPAAPIDSVEAGVKHLERLYRLATAETMEADVEKRILERMKKAAQTAEPARGVPSAGRKERSKAAGAKSLEEAFDIATEETRAEFGI
jgi:hypothetical protein